jgi:hypothetical protein
MRQRLFRAGALKRPKRKCKMHIRSRGVRPGKSGRQRTPQSSGRTTGTFCFRQRTPRRGRNAGPLWCAHEIAPGSGCSRSPIKIGTADRDVRATPFAAETCLALLRFDARVIAALLARRTVFASPDDVGTGSEPYKGVRQSLRCYKREANAAVHVDERETGRGFTRRRGAAGARRQTKRYSSSVKKSSSIRLNSIVLLVRTPTPCSIIKSAKLWPSIRTTL